MPQHNIPPLFRADSQVLILGSFPSVKSREQQFFYGHPQNRFWKVMAALCETAVPETIEEKKEMLYAHHIAVWDVIASCDITGSSDASIANVAVNDLSAILAEANIKKICTNGNKSYQLYTRYIYPQTGIRAISLPSTSPANAQYSLEKLIKAWKEKMEGGLEME